MSATTNGTTKFGIKLRRITPPAPPVELPKPRTLDDISDPRPDCASDSAAWETLLRLAYVLDVECYAALHCLRCGGLKLSKTPAGGLKLEPRYCDGAWCDEARSFGSGDTWWAKGEERTWQRDRDTILVPYRAQIATLLKLLKEEYQELASAL